MTVTSCNSSNADNSSRRGMETFLIVSSKKGDTYIVFNFCLTAAYALDDASQSPISLAAQHILVVVI